METVGSGELLDGQRSTTFGYATTGSAGALFY